MATKPKQRRFSCDARANPHTIRVAVLAASTKTGRAVIEALLADPRKPKVTGYYRDLGKVPGSLLANPDFMAKRGDMCDGKSLDLDGADAVLAITPPRSDGEDVEDHARLTSQNVRNAVRNSKTVKRLVYLSSVGAEFESGVGEIKSNHLAEKILSDASFDVTFIRAAFFMENWSASVAQAKSTHSLSSSVPHGWAIPMVSISDIAQGCRHVLLARFTGSGRRGEPLVFELHGPRPYDAGDLERAFTEAAGGEEVKVDTVPKERLAEYFCSKTKLPVNLVPEFVEMTRSFLPGGVIAEAQVKNGEAGMGWDMRQEKGSPGKRGRRVSVRRGDMELVDVVRNMWAEVAV